ncbi:amino acid/amide ABC transporter ATP-binding protein 2 (HAAT family) [Antricoccus suffuscus]|uniref:Amino acid/amide ABC transporter ATP-binding protein 2 (HAAT family) n=1 Tax=Antricoccus suffuscus TaxID=1629062 RepID=A0A2T1A1W4_9ACTN|nr:ABC transporter ATP-binding protein [Antricoccus suffuscus]PRZ42524.1 amino acid/amide ABC transporter ATP-binding protein 2 (HAAT family) [Antricoccus suffuscus]
MILSAEDVYGGYGTRRVLHGISIQVDAGQCVAVVGANGVGKSTLLRSIAGQVPLLSGRVMLDGEDVSGQASSKLVRKGLVLCPEGRHLFSGLTVRENLIMGVTPLKVNAADTEFRIAAAAEMFPVIRERARQAAGTLSGGEQQMVAIARALVARPRVMILDEPTLGLSPIMTDTVIAAIQQIVADGTAVLLAEQNVRASLAISDFGYVIEGGRVVVSGTGADLLDDAAVVAAYLGIEAEIAAPE